MGRKRKGMPIHGWLALDKPYDMSSMQAVSMCRRTIGAAKAGHGGTLDPLATGVLPIAFGDATKLISFVMDGEKEYEFEIMWGEFRSTDDAEGEITETCDKIPSREEVINTLPDFIGEIEQIPPAYSAIKIGGKRAYSLARKGETVELNSRKVRIKALELIDHLSEDKNKSRFRVACGKGTYVRSLARDLAYKLGTMGYLSSLRRTKSGFFSKRHTISLEKVKELGHSALESECFFSIDTVLDDILAVNISEESAMKLANGQLIELSDTQLNELKRYAGSEQAAGNLEFQNAICVRQGNKMVALAKLSGNLIAPVRVMSSYLND